MFIDVLPHVKTNCAHSYIIPNSQSVTSGQQSGGISAHIISGFDVQTSHFLYHHHCTMPRAGHQTEHHSTGWDNMEILAIFKLVVEDELSNIVLLHLL